MTAVETLAERAIAAYAAEQEAAKQRQASTDAGSIMRLTEALKPLGIDPAGPAFRNRADGALCVLVIERHDDRRCDEDGDLVGDFRPQVAAAIRHGEPWILAEEIDGDDPGYLLPVGPLCGLDVVGRAVTEGGRRVWEPPTVEDQVRRALASVSGDFVDSNGAVFLSGCEAICTALLDVAAAIREAGAR